MHFQRNLGGSQSRMGAALTASLAVLAVASAAASQSKYQVTTILGPWCGGAWGFPVMETLGLGRAANVVGYYYCGNGPERAFLWSPGSGLTTLSLAPGFGQAQALDVTDSG